MFYNEDRKNAYLNDENFRFADSAKDFLTIIFNKTARVELDEEMDLSDFNKNQIHTLLKSFNSKSKAYLRLVCSYFLDYYSWCIREGFVDKTNIQSLYDYNIVSTIIDELVPAKLVSDKYFTKNELLSHRGKILDKGSEFLVYAMFSGIIGKDYEDIANLKLSDINIEEKTVKLYSGKTIFVDDLFIELAIDTDKLTIYAPDGVYEANRTKNNVYIDSEYIVKPCLYAGTLKVSGRIIAARLRKVQQQLGNKQINTVNLYFNGLVNYVKEKFELKGITLEDAIYKEKNKRKLLHGEELQQYINEFGSNMTINMFKYRIGDYLDCFID